MYLLAKIHKHPMKTKAIMSYAGSICHGIAKWLDIYLKKIVKHMPYVATSSAKVVKQITQQQWPSNTSLFTSDAVSMYTNIHLDHALPVILEFLKATELGQQICRKESINTSALAAALELVMRNNVFCFGDTYFLQTSGTAMGTPPAPTYATLYFAIWEATVVPEFPELQLYTRYIDDCYGMWTHATNTDLDTNRWTLFQNRMNAFGTNHHFFHSNQHFRPLTWEFEERSNEVIFLDLRISILNGHINTTIYEKPLNLHLYIPPHSCHSPGVLKGLIFGFAKRAKALCTTHEDRIPFMKKTFMRLLDRGHDPATLRPIFHEALKVFNDTPIARKKKRTNKPLFLHLPYNPADPPSSRIQRAFQNSIVQPPGDARITDLQTMNDFGGTADFDSLIVCYHGQRNLGNILSPRKLRLGPSYSIDATIAKLRDNG